MSALDFEAWWAGAVRTQLPVSDGCSHDIALIGWNARGAAERAEGAKAERERVRAIVAGQNAISKIQQASLLAAIDAPAEDALCGAVLWPTSPRTSRPCIREAGHVEPHRDVHGGVWTNAAKPAPPSPAEVQMSPESSALLEAGMIAAEQGGALRRAPAAARPLRVRCDDGPPGVPARPGGFLHRILGCFPRGRRDEPPQGERMTTVYDLAREAFNTYAALDAPHLPSDPAPALQLRLARWQTHHFGAGQIVHVALGIGEEIGELLEALESPDGENTVDAIADINIYAMQMSTLLRLDYLTLLQHGAPEVTTTRQIITDLGSPDYWRACVKACARLQHAVLKNAQNIRGMGDQETFRQAVSEELAKIANYTENIADLEHIRFWESIRSTAETVMKRDWTAERAKESKS